MYRENRYTRPHIKQITPTKTEGGSDRKQDVFRWVFVPYDI